MVYGGLYSLVVAACWVVILTAMAGDKRNSMDGRREEAVHALFVTISLAFSTLIYWLYLSLVIYVSWFVISALRIAMNPSAGLQIGVVFATYSAFVVLLGSWSVIRRRVSAAPPKS